jgi:hypothetical protein
MVNICFNLFEDQIVKSYIDLQYENAVIRSYRERVLVRELYAVYKIKFIDFIELIQKTGTFSIIASIDNFAKKDKPDYHLVLETMPSCPYKDLDYNLLSLTVPEAIKELELENTISYSYLWDKYAYKFYTTKSDEERQKLNWYFMTVFSKFYVDIKLSSLIELYLDIIFYEKEFDGVFKIESIVFNNGVIPNGHLVKQSLNLYTSIVKCYHYIKDIPKGKTLLEKLYDYMDQNFDTSFKYAEENKEMYNRPNISNGVILKADRDEYNQFLNNLSTNWTFSETKQVENAFRLNLITEQKYINALNRHKEKEQLLKNEIRLFEESLKNYRFLSLKSEEYIWSLDIHDEKRIYPEVYFFDELKHEQLAEYKTAFSEHATAHSVRKFFNIRLCQLDIALQNSEYSADEIIKELNIIKIVNKNESIDHLIENIKALEILRKDINKQLLEKINIIREELKTDQKSICVLFDNQYYRFYQSLGYREALKLPATIIEIAAKGGNIEESDWFKWHNESNNFEITFAASRLEDNRYQKDNKTLVSTRKEDAPLLVNLLERDCINFMTFFYENIKPNQTVKFIGAPISKLITAYITIKNYEKAIYWADEFLKVITEYNPPYPGCDVAEILNKKEKCLLYISASNKNSITKENNKFKLFEEAREFARSLGLKSENEWREYKKTGLKPENIPAKPEMVYKNKGWKGFKDWLGS